MNINELKSKLSVANDDFNKLVNDSNSEVNEIHTFLNLLIYPILIVNELFPQFKVAKLKEESVLLAAELSISNENYKTLETKSNNKVIRRETRWVFEF